MLEEGGLPHDGLMLTTIYVTIGLSVLAHGLTAAPLANRYASWHESHPREASPTFEGSEVQDVRWRRGLGHPRALTPPAAEWLAGAQIDLIGSEATPLGPATLGT